MLRHRQDRAAGARGSSVHAFDLMAVDRYAADGIGSQRTVRSRYDIPPPLEVEDHGQPEHGAVPAMRLPRSEEATSRRSGARTTASTRAQS